MRHTVILLVTLLGTACSAGSDGGDDSTDGTQGAAAAVTGGVSAPTATFVEGVANATHDWGVAAQSGFQTDALGTLTRLQAALKPKCDEAATRKGQAHTSADTTALDGVVHFCAGIAMFLPKAIDLAKRAKGTNDLSVQMDLATYELVVIGSASSFYDGCLAGTSLAPAPR